MAIKRTTMQDIADACGLSRNTVSKIFNGRGSVPEATKKAVLEKAREMGYVQLPKDAANAPDAVSKNIALLYQHKLQSHHFGVRFITTFTDQICRRGYNIKMFEISDEEVSKRQLPPHLHLEETAGILCIELFNKSYQDMVTSLGIPCVFVDSFARANITLLNCDFVTMENYAATVTLMEHLFKTGAHTIGFVGDREHCNSFFERWLGYVTSLMIENISIDEHICILDRDGDHYANTDWLIQKLNVMPKIPNAFVCANDFLAVHLMTALKRKGLRIPEDVMVTGFDGSPESTLVEPTLTTVSISEDIGRLSAEVLIKRITCRDRPFCRIAVQSTPVWGGSAK